jgi:hypothetical protein
MPHLNQQKKEGPVRKNRAFSHSNSIHPSAEKRRGTHFCIQIPQLIKIKNLNLNQKQTSQLPSMCRCVAKSKPGATTQSKSSTYKTHFHSLTGKPFHRTSTAAVSSSPTPTKQATSEITFHRKQEIEPELP